VLLGEVSMMAESEDETTAATAKPPPATKARQLTASTIAKLVIGIAIAPWVGFLFFLHKPVPRNPAEIIFICTIVAGMIAALLYLVIKRASGWMIAIMFVAALLTLIVSFAIMYWDIGTTHNFNIRLSRLDAVYFVLGTLTTGTGNIVAVSELSRAIQTIQIVCNLMLMVFAGGVIVSRFADNFK
jgi:Ion channel